MSVFDVVSKHVDWVSQRYAVAAANVANLDTPGFRAKTIEPFQLEMGNAAFRLAATNSSHLGTTAPGSHAYSIVDKPALDETHSGNNVSLEGEMRTIGESSRMMSIDTSLYKLFHRMVLTSIKAQ